MGLLALEISLFLAVSMPYVKGCKFTAVHALLVFGALLSISISGAFFIDPSQHASKMVVNEAATASTPDVHPRMLGGKPILNVRDDEPRPRRTLQQRQAQPRVALAEAHAQREATTTTAAAKEPESVFVYRSDDYFGGSGAKAVDAAALDAADAAPQMIPASWWQRWAADSADDAERNDTAARARRRAPEEANASVSSAAAAGGGGGGAHRGVLDKQLERELDLAAAAGRVALFPRGGARTDRGALVAGLASPMAQFVDM